MLLKEQETRFWQFNQMLKRENPFLIKQANFEKNIDFLL
jgi:hypothetical protein